ncbi:cucumber peeling cupredoxin [Nicotiana tabacum]|uniref:cucumber peeling cupredoxin n=1 Tax=Nicotiana tabacum TaxID=4097 RepID=UPI003F4ED3A6
MDMIMRMVLFGALALASLVQLTTAQTAHVVGDNEGWTIPSSGASAYTNWAAGKTFMVGDTLVFNFMTNTHDVLQVPKASFDGCSSQNAIGSAIMSGPANVTLDSAGERYYICTFGRHCQNGQKLAITVSSSTGTPGANPPTSFAAGPSGSVPGGIAPPPPPSSSTTVFASFLLGLSSIALAIFL